MTSNELRSIIEANRSQLVSLREIAEARGRHVTAIRMDSQLAGFPQSVLTVGNAKLYLAPDIVEFYNTRQDARRGPAPGADAVASAQRVAALAEQLS